MTSLSNSLQEPTAGGTLAWRGRLPRLSSHNRSADRELGTRAAVIG